MQSKDLYAELDLIGGAKGDQTPEGMSASFKKVVHNVPSRATA